jgi:hypothetical protein
MLRWWLIDDIYKPDEYGSNILVDMAGVPSFNRCALAEDPEEFEGARASHELSRHS